MPGVCRLGDKSKAHVDVHGCPACPHPNVQGPSVVASSNVFINGMPGLRINDMGIHTACCGPNQWKIIGASGQVFLNGAQLVRQGDPTLHCGGPGEMIDASGNVSDGSPMVAEGAPGADPMVNLGAFASLGAAGAPGANPAAGFGNIDWTSGIGQAAAGSFATGGLDAMSQVIDKKVVAPGELGKWVPEGAETAAKALKYGGIAADLAINVGPDIIHGDTHDAIKHTVSTAAGVAAGGAVGGVCEGGTLGLGTPACFAAGVATSTGVSFAVDKVYDPVVHLGGAAVHAGGKAVHFLKGLLP